jgi:two-component system response regulator HydG
MPKILVVEDDIAFCKMLEKFLKKQEYDVLAIHSGEEAFIKIHEQKFDLVLTDVRLPNKDGNAILEEIQKSFPTTQVILMTGYAEVNFAVEAIKKGAFDYISKPVQPDKLLEIIQKALSSPKTQQAQKPDPKQKPKTRTTEQKPAKTKSDYLVGVSDASKKLNDYVRLVAPTDMSVLIEGESGTGKEFVAKNIHNQSKRSSHPFVAVDCGAIPSELATSEFFGHIKGSITGAINDKTGAFLAADKGTLFLDEIGNLNYELQIQLLRALQERRVKPVGSNKEIDVDIRVVVATNEDLKEAVSQKDFREDLYHRLNEFSIQVPSLKNREEDLLLFAHHFLEKANDQLEKDIDGFSDKVEKRFSNYCWPGNLREMQNVIKRAILLTENGKVQMATLPSSITEFEAEEKEYSLFKNKNEEQMIRDALKETGGNKSKAARVLNIDRKTLYNKLKRYNIETD